MLLLLLIVPTRSSFKKDISYLFVPFFIASLFNKAKNKRKSSGLWTAKTHYTSGNRRPKKKGASCAPPTAVPCEHSGRRSTSGKLQGPQRGQRSPPGCALKGQTADLLFWPAARREPKKRRAATIGAPIKAGGKIV